MSRAYKGDEVYFHKGGQPCAGKVVCAGRHGCTVEHEGQQHKIKWAHIAGHKKRAPQNFRVIDHGDDGMIVENEGGQRRYLAVPPESRAERLQVDPEKSKKPSHTL